MRYTITVKNEDIHKIKIEPVNEFDKSYFSQTYRRAWEAVRNIHMNQPNNSDSNKSDAEQEDNTRYKNHVTTNNVILFTGERGSGKSSAMASFSKALEHNSEDALKFLIKDEKKRGNLGDLQFKVMDIIDPSYFTPKRNLLYVFVSNLFKEFKRIAVKNPLPVNRNIDPVLKLFSRAFKAIQHLDLDFASQTHSDAIERLDDLSESLDLDALLGKLIEKFMKLCFSDRTPKDSDPDLTGKYIVVPIDDLDMCVDHAFELLEQTRKFLIQNHVIILMAANFDQLKLELEEHYLESFKLMKNKTTDSSSIGSLSEIEEMTSRYLGKIVPPSRRLNVSHIDIDFMDTYLCIVDRDDPDKFEPTHETLLQNRILRLIWEKTGLIFIPEENQLHAIVPDNLRALHQLIYLLNNMDKTKLEKQDESNDANKVKIEKGVTIQDNFYSFKNYIMNYWIPFHLSSEEQEVFTNLPMNIGRINKYLIQSINYIGNQYKKKIVIKDVDLNLIYGDTQRQSPVDRDIYTMVSVNDPKFMEANKISDPFNHPSNNSMGDILLLIDKYEVYFESRKAVTFINAVKIFYSLLLFEHIFIKSHIRYKDYSIVNDIDETKNSNKGKKLELNDIEILPIQLLIGGTTYYPHYFELFDRTKSTFHRTYRDSFEKAKKQIFNNEIEKITQKEQEKPTIYRKEEIMKRIEKDLIREIKDYEYYFPARLPCSSDNNTSDLLSYFTLYYGENRPERPFRKHIYDTTFLDGKRTEKDSPKDNLYIARFDVLAPLVNMLNPIHTYLRSSEKPWSSGKKGDFTCEILKWLHLNPIIEGDATKEIRLQTYFPLYSVDVMLELLRIRHDDDIKPYKEAPNSLDSSVLLENTRKYLRGLEKEYLRIVKKHLGEGVRNYLRDQLEDNPMRKYLKSPDVKTKKAFNKLKLQKRKLELYKA